MSVEVELKYHSIFQDQMVLRKMLPSYPFLESHTKHMRVGINGHLLAKIYAANLPLFLLGVFSTCQKQIKHKN